MQHRHITSPAVALTKDVLTWVLMLCSRGSSRSRPLSFSWLLHHPVSSSPGRPLPLGLFRAHQQAVLRMERWNGLATFSSPARSYSMSTKAGKKGGHFARKSAGYSLQST